MDHWTREVLPLPCQTAFRFVDRPRGEMGSRISLVINVVVNDAHTARAYQKVPQDSARAPQQPISPALDTAFPLVEYEDGSAPDEFALVVTKTTGHLWHDTSTHALKDDEGIVRARAGKGNLTDVSFDGQQRWPIVTQTHM